MRVDTRFGLVLTVGLFASVSLVLAQSKTTTGPTVKPTAVATKASTTTAAPSGAKATKTAGGNKETVSTANSASDDDSFWVEKLDVDGDGDVEDSNLVWDDEDKVLFAYSVGAFTCKNGGTATAELLVATNAAGNARGRPAGSGFWVADLDKGECGSAQTGLWGCKFDATGTETACGVATIDDKTDDIVIVTASK
jgi:anti-sigma factor RsiW